MLLDLRITSDLVEVVVWGSDPVLPIARAADVGRVSQHGLEIVMAVAQGVEAKREPVGKRITARLALVDDPGGAISGRPPVAHGRPRLACGARVPWAVPCSAALIADATDADAFVPRPVESAAALA